MAHEPDWQALSDFQFMVYNRIADSLNAALSAIALSDMPEAQDKPPGYWKNRAAVKIANVLNLFMAWSYLIRFKLGESIPERAIRPFHANGLLAWLGNQLQLSPAPSVPNNPLLHANQETLQEALMLLYSAAFTQGTGIRLELETSEAGMWFRVQFTRLAPLPGTLEELLATFGDHWRARDTVFELTTARDFVRLNGSELVLRSNGQYGEFGFFVRSAHVTKSLPPLPPAVEAAAAARSATPAPAVAKAGAPTLSATKTAPLTPGAAAAPAPPVAATVQEIDRTPVMPDTEGISKPVAQPPPRLADLHPRYPTISSTSAQPPVPPSVAEGKAPPVEPEEAQSKPVEAPKAAVNQAAPDLSAPSPAQLPAEKTVISDQTATPGHLIVPVKLPAPQPPSALHTPPASTSNVALTRDTQTMHPVATPAPAEGQDASSGESEKASPASTREETS